MGVPWSCRGGRSYFRVWPQNPAEVKVTVDHPTWSLVNMQLYMLPIVSLQKIFKERNSNGFSDNTILRSPMSFFEWTTVVKIYTTFTPVLNQINCLLTIVNWFRELLGLDNEEYIKEDEHTHNSSKYIKNKKANNKLRKSEKNRSSLKSIKTAIRDGE